MTEAAPPNGQAAPIGADAPAAQGLHPSDAPRLTLTAHGALPSDADRGLVRLDPADMAKLHIASGDVVAITARRTTHARALPAHGRFRGQSILMLDGLQRDNAGAVIGETVEIRPLAAPPAEAVTLTLQDSAAAGSAAFLRQVRESLASIPVVSGDRLRVRLVGGRTLMAEVGAVSPSGPALITPSTRLSAADAASGKRRAPSHAVNYEDLGGLSRELAKVREMIELPLRRPELFAHLGVEAPKGVLLTGPPGTGKTLLARAVAAECQAAFLQINGPEIVTKHYGESEAQLRDVFKQARAKVPAIVFIDEIDAIAPKRDQLAGDRQVERRIVAQLLTLLDGMAERGQVVVMAATNLPDSLDPALRRPGRFDREIAFSAPDRAGRREILDVHTRGMPLSETVDLDAVAAAAHGFVGADLAALAREAAMAALRRVDALDAQGAAALETLRVTPADFEAARRDVTPSAIREVFTEIPDVGWADVGGLEEVKQTLTEAVLWPLTHPQAFARLGLAPQKGVLLHGAPGAGKTHIAKALASEARVNFIAVRPAQILSQYVGEAERNVARIFAKARQAAPCILFFDEIDALAPRRGQAGDGVAERVVAQLLTDIDGVEPLDGVFLLAATNRVAAVDAALLRPGRFDVLLETPPPDEAARRAILAIHAADLPLGVDVDLQHIARDTRGLLGADLKELCRTAARLALRRAAADAPQRRTGDWRNLEVTSADFHAARALRRRSDAARTPAADPLFSDEAGDTP